MYPPRARLVDPHGMRVSLSLVLAIAMAAPALGSPLPDDARLSPVRAALDRVIAGAAHNGLPEGLLTDKVREGLAKHVPPARILGVVRNLASGLAQARDQVRPYLKGARPTPELLKAIVGAHALGLQPRTLDPVLAAAAPKGVEPTARAVEVLTDLVERGYPAAAAVRTVSVVAGRDSRALGRLTALAEALTSDGASRGEALDALAQAGATGLGLDRAAQLLHHNPNASGPSDQDRGPDRDTSGERGPGANHSSHGHGRP